MRSFANISPLSSSSSMPPPPKRIRHNPTSTPNLPSATTTNRPQDTTQKPSAQIRHPARTWADIKPLYSASEQQPPLPRRIHRAIATPSHQPPSAQTAQQPRQQPRTADMPYTHDSSGQYPAIIRALNAHAAAVLAQTGTPFTAAHDPDKERLSKLYKERQAALAHGEKRKGGR
ncbi:hypothetical protein MMC12_000610 [Toensbergia leucococca]|nr:hypothetical protein [Toensbergia leucococca]